MHAVDEPDSTWAYRFCDIAIMRTSSTSLELPFWDKPAVQLPSTSYPGLVRAQAAMVAGCSAVRSNPSRPCQGCLAGPLPRPAPQDYATARALVRLDSTRDAYTQTVEALQSILAAPRASGLANTPAQTSSACTMAHRARNVPGPDAHSPPALRTRAVVVQAVGLACPRRAPHTSI